MTPRRLAAAAVLALTLTGALSACGSDDDEPSSEVTTAVTDDVEDEAVEEELDDETALFIADANAVCADYYGDINTVGEYLDPADPSTVTTDFLPLVQALQDDLSALAAPEEIAADYDAVLAEQQLNLDAITADPAALFEIDGAATNDAFDALGLIDCGSGSSDISPSRGGSRLTGRGSSAG